MNDFIRSMEVAQILEEMEKLWIITRDFYPLITAIKVGINKYSILFSSDPQLLWNLGIF